jgi:hypothetical protein
MTTIRVPGQPGGVGASGGKVTPIGTVGTGGAQVIAGNPNRAFVIFHNPGINTLYVYPMTQANGQPLAPTLAALGGAFEIVPAAQITFTGECQVAWGALAASGATNPLTIFESNIN